MTGQIIFFMICLVAIFFFNAADFVDLYEGCHGFFPVVCGGHFTIRRVSAVFPTFIFIMVIPQLVFGLQGKEESFLTIVLYIVYLLIYTYLYFMIKKKKEERDKKNGTI